MGHDLSRPPGTRCIALVGPFQSGKTSLFEAILAQAGAIAKAGNVESGTTVGDANAEARQHRMGTGLTIANAAFMGDNYTFIDCPGSLEFVQDMRAALPTIDAAVVVCEADERKLPQLQIILRELEDRGIPRFLFLNKIDKTTQRVQQTLVALQSVSRTPLVLRQIPIWVDDRVDGFVDLALERAYIYRDNTASQIELAGENLSRERQARFMMLEKLADHDDALMEQLLDDIAPEAGAIFNDLVRELREGLICPVLIGSATRESGVLRLLKALRHEAPGVDETVRRLGINKDGSAVAYVLKTLYLQHGGKLSYARVLAGSLEDGAQILSSAGKQARIAGLTTATVGQAAKVATAQTGDIVALGKLDLVRTGDVITTAKKIPVAIATPPLPQPLLARAIAADDRKDDVKLGQALQRLLEEDPTLVLINDANSRDVVLWGQGEMHLRVALERLRERFGIAITSRTPGIGYRETIRKPITQRGRHKKQSGGHGQFGDVVLEVKPLPRGAGIAFDERIVGGAVPRNYVGAIQDGVADGLLRGPLGFPVTDVHVTLTDGSYHSVDSSDMAFRTAARIGISEALPQCLPVLLEPIHDVEIVCPSAYTARINAILTSRHGQILGFNTRDGWEGWDLVKVQLPEADIGDLIVDLRSATAGAASYTSSFDHMAEVTGRAAEQIVAAKTSAA